jgi:hypothetical protein
VLAFCWLCVVLLNQVSCHNICAFVKQITNK